MGDDGADSPLCQYLSFFSHAAKKNYAKQGETLKQLNAIHLTYELPQLNIESASSSNSVLMRLRKVTEVRPLVNLTNRS